MKSLIKRRRTREGEFAVAVRTVSAQCHRKGVLALQV